MRSAVARQHGLDEATEADVFDSPDRLEAHQRAAIELADALMTRPGDLTDQQVTELRRHFTDQQLVELTLDVMKWNYQKVAVAMGTDFELKPGEIAELRFDERGHFIRPD